MRHLTLDIWVKAIERTPTHIGSYKTKIGDMPPKFLFFDGSEARRKEWVNLNLEWREVK